MTERKVADDMLITKLQVAIGLDQTVGRPGQLYTRAHTHTHTGLGETRSKEHNIELDNSHCHG